MKNEIKREKNNIKNHKTNGTDTGGLLTMKGGRKILMMTAIQTTTKKRIIFFP